MKFLYTIAAAMFGLCAAMMAPANEPPAAPVLVELFTSEGCSSCPPADALLEKLDRLQPVPGARVIVLSEHVDYWNHIGWKDPYSSAEFSARQGAYARRLRLDQVYTPQMVIDGREQFVGSDAGEIKAAIARSAAVQKVPLIIRQAKTEGSEAVIQLEVERLPDHWAFSKADLWVAIADDKDVTAVKRGENSGRTLSHVAVVRSLAIVGVVSKKDGFSKTVRLPMSPGGGDRRVVAFLQQPGNGTISGVALSALASHSEK